MSARPRASSSATMATSTADAHGVPSSAARAQLPPPGGGHGGVELGGALVVVRACPTASHPSRSATWAAESRSAPCSGERRTSISPPAPRRKRAAQDLARREAGDGVDHDDAAQLLVGRQRVGDELLELALGDRCARGRAARRRPAPRRPRSSGTPNTAQSRTAGCPCSTASTSAGATWKPLTLIISFDRSVRCTQPSGSSQPTSPVRYQPSSTNASALAASGR